MTKTSPLMMILGPKKSLRPARGRVGRLGLLLALGTWMTVGACDRNRNLNFLSVDQDVQLGTQTDAQIMADPAQFPILDEVQHAEAYAYINRIKDAVINSGQLTYRNEFVWRVRIINDPNTLNAFATPGGFMYFYTGLIKFLDTEDQLAGVMGHEAAHADLRHTSRQITQQQGYGVLIGILTGGNSGALAQIASQFKDLAYSRAYEREADAASVRYLAETPYACNGAAGFFEKLIAQGSGSSTPEFLSTHPNPDNRVESINRDAQQRGCSTSPVTPTTYAQFKAMLP